MSLRDYIATFAGKHDEATAASDADGKGESKSNFKPYMRAWYFSDDHPELEEDFPNPPPYFPDKFKGVEKNFQPPFTWIFVGPPGVGGWVGGWVGE
jgi:histone arginine demethylase JMJD6